MERKISRMIWPIIPADIPPSELNRYKYPLEGADGLPLLFSSCIRVRVYVDSVIRRWVRRSPVCVRQKGKKKKKKNGRKNEKKILP